MSKKFLGIFLAVAAVILVVSFITKGIAFKKNKRLVRVANLRRIGAVHEHAKEFFSAGDYDKAITFFEAVIKRSAEPGIREEAFLSLADSYKAKKDYVKTRETLKDFIERMPMSEKTEKARKDVEDLNMQILFSPTVAGGSVLYEIRPGDTLTRIAASFNTTVELIKKSNGLKTNIIHPGKLLKVNNTGFSIMVDKSRNTLQLKDSYGETLKTYSVATGADFSTPVGTFKIEEKLVSPVWYKVGAVVEPTSPEYELGTRWMGISEPGYGIHGTGDPSSIGKHVTKGCVRMKNSDVEELYAIVPSGTEVKIVDNL